MLNRDFSKNTFEYIKKNKVPIIAVCIILIVGLIMGLTLGMNTNFELTTHQQFSVTISEENVKNKETYISKIKEVLNVYDADYDYYQISGKGDNTQIIVRYMTKLSDSNQVRVNNAVAEALDVEISKVSDHVEVGAIVKNYDYIYAAMVILLIIVVVSLFALFRYNGASAMAIISTNILANLLLMCASIIFRLKIGISYFTVLVVLNALIIYSSLMMFENIKSNSWLVNKEYNQAINQAMKSAKFRNGFIAVALELIGIAFVLFATLPIKSVSLNICYAAVVYLFATQYVLPFVWNICITKTSSKHKKDTPKQ